MKRNYKTKMNIGEEIDRRVRMRGCRCDLSDYERSGVDDAIAYLYSSFMPYIIQADLRVPGEAWARGVRYGYYPNGIAWVSGIHQDAELVRIPQAIFVEGRTYLVVAFNPEIVSRKMQSFETQDCMEDHESRLVELYLSSTLQYISSYSLYLFKNLRSVVCDPDGRYSTIEGNLYLRLYVPQDSLELIWFSPFFTKDKYVAPENLVKISKLDFKDEDSVPVMKLPQEFWKRQTSERRFVALNGQYDLFLSEGGLILKETYYALHNDETYSRIDVNRIQEPSRTLHIITPIARDGMNISIRGIDLDRIYEEIEEIQVHVIKGWDTISDWWSTRENFIKDFSKLPNLRKYECFYDEVDSLAEIEERE